MGWYEYLKTKLDAWFFNGPYEYTTGCICRVDFERAVLEKRVESIQTTLNLISENHSKTLEYLQKELCQLRSKVAFLEAEAENKSKKSTKKSKK